MYYNTSNFKIVIGNIRKFNNRNKESTCLPSAYKKHLVHFLKNILFQCKVQTETLGNPGFIHSAEI